MFPNMYPQYNWGNIGSVLGQLAGSYFQPQQPTAYPYSTYNYSPSSYLYGPNSSYMQPAFLDTYNTGMLSGSSGILILGAILVVVILLVR